MLCTGLRIGEFLAIDFNNINYQTRTIFINRTVDIKNNTIKPYTKTDSSTRHIIFLPEIDKYFKYINKQLKQGQALTYNSVRKFFKRQYKKLQIKRNLHSFRHTFISMAYYVGIKPKIIQCFVGHATIEMTMNTYTHLLEPGNSIFLNYFEKLKEALNNRSTDFFKLNSS